jgi:hypothetical protein
MNNGLVNHTEAEGTVRRGGGAVSGTLFSGSPAPPRQLVVAVAVVDVVGREQTTLSPAAAQHGALSPAVWGRAPLYSGIFFGKRYGDVILTSIRVLQREGTRCGTQSFGAIKPV